MCVVRVSLLRGQSDEFLAAVSAAIYDALVEFYGMAPNDMFQIFEQLQPNELIFDRHYGGGPRSDGFIMLNILGGPGHSTEVKRAFYAGVNKLLQERAQVRPEDIFISLQSAAAEDWSFGSGRPL